MNGNQISNKQKEKKVCEDGTNSFFWRAHTISAGVLIALGLIYVAVVEPPSSDTVYNLQRGVVAVAIVFILIGIIHLPNGPFVRPHPAFWRLVLCVLILYILLLVFMFFQTVDDARQLLRLIDSSLGRPLEEKNYATDCRVYTPGHPDGTFANFMEKMDIFVPSHFIGWWIKTLIVRDWFLLTVFSIGFELLEYTLEVHLPNFGECWWDHWVLDALVCNSLGILLGMLTCHWLEMRTYNWRGLWETPTFKGKMKRVAGQFTPHSWTHYYWGYTESLGHLFAVTALGFAFLLQEVNLFYLKTILWYPPNHMLNAYRSLLFALAGACAFREVYDYLSSNDKDARIGRYVWLMFITVFCEDVLIVKMGWDIVSIPLTRTAVAFWTSLTGVYLVWVIWHFTPLSRAIRMHYFRKLLRKS